MNPHKNANFQPINGDTSKGGMPPLIWGGLLGLATFGFLALMLSI